MSEPLTLADVCPRVSRDKQDYLVVGVNDLGCYKCDRPQFVCIAATAQGANEAILACRDPSHLVVLHDAVSHVQYLIEDRLKLIMNQDGLVAASQRIAVLFSVANVGSSTRADAGNSFKKGTETAASDHGEQAPEGYRTVSWIREYEAELILSSYTNERGFSLRSDDGVVFFETEFYSLDSQEAQKFKAQVLAIRIRKSGKRNVGWIRREEARAVLDAYQSQKDISFLHTSFGRGGLVQFFSEDSPVATKYRSQTRLLRKR